MADQLTHEDFQPHLNKAFQVKGVPFSFTLSKVEVPAVSPQEMQARKAANLGRMQPFTLVFTAPCDKLLHQGAYTICAEGAPDFEVYLIPIRTFAAGMQDYQAVFN
jgi:hypothetical protein